MENHKELLLVAEAVSKEKGIETQDVLDALAEGMETALRRDFPEGTTLHVTINENTGEIKAYRVFELVDQIENVENQMLTSEVEDELVVDGYVWEPYSFTLNRQQFNITKQVAFQKIKNDSRDSQIQVLIDKPVALLNGTVKFIKKEQLIVDCNGLDITIYKRNLLPRDNYKMGDKIYFVLEKEKNHYVGTRISDQYLIEVFKRELFEIEEGDIQITAVARIPGFRSKVVVKSLKKNLDPVRSCVGTNGSHIKNIQNYLNGETVDLILYQDEPVQLLIRAMAPVNVSRVFIDEDTNIMDIAVPDNEVAQAIGKNGKNIEMISKLLGWQVNVSSETVWNSNNYEQNIKQVATLMKGLNCEKEVADIILDAGFSSLEEIAYLPKDEFYIEIFDEETHNALRENAKSVCTNPEELSLATGFGELAFLGFTVSESEILQKEKVINNHDISELSTYDLQDILPAIDSERAKAIIMLSRQKQEIMNVENH